MLKTYDGWGESRQNLTEYLQVGDMVDEAMVDYFINVLPPITKNGLIQMGEPYSHTADGRGTYATLKRSGNGWQYCGHCCAGETEHKKGYYEMWRDFFNEAFGDRVVPSNIRSASEEICQIFSIRGICDPMYICNVIAVEMGLGDGCSNFYDKQPHMSKIEHVAQRLTGSYGCNITDAKTVESIIRRCF